MTVDWTVLWQGFWLGAGFWTATVAVFVFFVIVTAITSCILSILDEKEKGKRHD